MRCGIEEIEPIFNEEQQNAIKQFEQLYGQQSGLVSIDINTVVKAATLGRVGTLFTPLGVQRWGRFESQNGQVLLEEKPTLKNEDLLNFAVAQTLLNSGQVFALQPKEMPGNGELVAILRYER